MYGMSNVKRPRMDPDIGSPDVGLYHRQPQPNHILLFTIMNPSYPITTDVLSSICSPLSRVLRIVIFHKNGVQAMVEFENINAANKVLEGLNGCDIYSGCCTLKIEYALTDTLTVRINDKNSWDYTNPGLRSREDELNQNSARAPLLQEPNRNGPPGLPNEQSSNAAPRSDNYYSGVRGGRGGGGSSRGRGSGRGAPPRNFGGPPRSMKDAPPYHMGGPPMFHDSYGGHQTENMYGQDDGFYGSDMGLSPVCMVYGLNTEKVNPDRLFNLFCLYGNVGRIKFLKSIDGGAMVQMSCGEEVERIILFLNNISFFGNKLRVNYSKQTFIADVRAPYALAEGSDSYADFQQSRNNRFLNQVSAAKNRIQMPSHTLHYFNAPPDFSEEDVTSLFAAEEAIIKRPIKVKKFDTKSERSSGGLIEFGSDTDAIEALMIINHKLIPNANGKFPYIFKLCFSSSPRIST